MELLKNKDFRGLFIDITGEACLGSFVLNLCVTNLSDFKKNIILKAIYSSVDKGYIDQYITDPTSLKHEGIELLPNSFANVKIKYSTGVMKALDGDRVQLELNDGDLKSMVLIREKSKWYIQDIKDSELTVSNLIRKIEHFESIDEKFGLMLQNFSIKVINKKTIKLFCEVLSYDGDTHNEPFNIEVAIYDQKNNIVSLNTISKYDFKGFEVLGFGPINLDIPIDEISKIRFYPTK